MTKINLILAPLNKLGNLALRELCLNYGAEKVFSEMIRVEKIIEGEEYQLKKCDIPLSLQDKTIVQIIAEDFKNIEIGVKKILKISPNIKEINYNMGCPQSSLCKIGSGGAIIGNSEEFKKVANELLRVCNKFNLIPSIKLRIGIDRNSINIRENVKLLKTIGIKKIYIHGRTLRDTYQRKASFNEIAKVIEENRDLEIIPNGDIIDKNSFKNVIEITKANTFLIGRKALENPKIFTEIFKTKKNNHNGSNLEEKKQILLEFLYLARKYDISTSTIKANIAYLTKNIIGGNGFRSKINNCKNITEIENIIELI